MSKGSEEQFNVIVAELANISKQYHDAKTINHIKYSEKMDYLLGGTYGWSKQDFYRELRLRLGIQANNVLPPKSIVKKKTI